MHTVNVHEARTHLSRLIERVVNGEDIVIAEAGKPLVRLTAIDTPIGVRRRLGFMAGQIRIPDDFDHMGDA